MTAILTGMRRHLIMVSICISLMISEVNVRPETIQIIEENISRKILDTARSNILLDIYPQARETKEKIN